MILINDASLEQKANWLFDVGDADGDGELTFDEITALVKRAYKQAANQIRAGVLNDARLKKLYKTDSKLKQVANVKITDMVSDKVDDIFESDANNGTLYLKNSQ